VVAEMLRFIAREQQARRARPSLVHKAMSDGSPKAQSTQRPTAASYRLLAVDLLGPLDRSRLAPT
jgi:hypothetical protein